MSWSAYEELREIRENQERSDFEGWLRDNPGEAECFRQQHEASMEEMRRKKKEEEEAKTVKVDWEPGIIIMFAVVLLPNLSNLSHAFFITVYFVMLWILLKRSDPKRS